MAARFTLNPHEYKVKSGQAVLLRVTPYIRLCREGVSVYVQNGMFFTEGGGIFQDLPPWLSEELLRLTPAARKEVGLEPIADETRADTGVRKKGGWPKGRPRKLAPDHDPGPVEAAANGKPEAEPEDDPEPGEPDPGDDE